MLGNNMFAYCNNNPTCYSDPSGTALIEALIVAVGTEWAITIVISGVVLISGVVYQSLEALSNWLSAQWYRPFAQIHYSEKEPQEETVPDVTYPGDDPSSAPEGYEWKGKGNQGSKDGNYYNKETGESWHPDLNHPEGKDPHWDYNYRGSGSKGWRVYANGTIERKLMIPFIYMVYEWWDEYGR